MMLQVWFEMAEIHRRKLAAAAGMQLRAVQPICGKGKRGHLGFKEHFFGAGLLAVPVDLKEKAAKLGWCAPEEARDELIPLVGTRQLRLADVHWQGRVGGSEKAGWN